MATRITAISVGTPASIAGLIASIGFSTGGVKRVACWRLGSSIDN